MPTYDVVFIIDDDLTVNYVHQFLVKKSPLTDNVRCFTNPLQALDNLQELLQNGKSNILVLLDINMPEIDGFQFLERSSLFKGIKVVDIVMVTSSIDCSDLKRAMNHPLVLGCISKPLRIDDVYILKQSFTDRSKIY